MKFDGVSYTYNPKSGFDYPVYHQGYWWDPALETWRAWFKRTDGHEEVRSVPVAALPPQVALLHLLWREQGGKFKPCTDFEVSPGNGSASGLVVPEEFTSEAQAALPFTNSEAQCLRGY